jgi:large conductance mechanosensitive channel
VFAVFKEFREFAVKGNMLDLAVGLVLGTAFGAVVSSLVKDVIMPPIGWLLGGRDFSALFVVLREGKEAGPYASLTDAQKAGAITLNWGVFANMIITFLVVAFAMFFLVKAMNRFKKKDDKPAAPPKSEMLLEEIRDLLKAGK